MTKNLVGAVPDNKLGTAREVLRRLDEEEGYLEKLKLFNNGKFEELLEIQTGEKAVKSPFWKLERRLSKRLGRDIGVYNYPSQFTPEFLAKTARFNLKQVFLPGMQVSRYNKFKRWEKLSDWFYEMSAEGTISSLDDFPSLGAERIFGAWYLADFTVEARNEPDPLTGIISELRQAGLIGKHEEDCGRFGISYNEWHKVVLIRIAQELGVWRSNVHLERAVEYNAIANLYDFNRGKFSMYELFEDTFTPSPNDCLCGGHRLGEVMHVERCSKSDTSVSLFARPLIRF